MRGRGFAGDAGGDGDGGGEGFVDGEGRGDRVSWGCEVEGVFGRHRGRVCLVCVGCAWIRRGDVRGMG